MQKALHVFKIFLIAWPLVTLMTGIVIAQDYGGALDYFFLGRQPSAKAEAMGKAMVATGTDAFSSFYNPASISQNKGLLLSTSYATPYYLADNANYKFMGATYELGKYGVLGLSLYRFRLGLFREDINDHGFPDVNKNNLTDFTYGLGIEIPINKFTRTKTPLNVKLDITTMKQPSFSKNFDNWENFSVYNLSVNWRFKN